jgi:TolB-like protein/Flp pilus assembly protein TadD/tRNA A-37 threonylcarbamoyl transferase component Bud32
MADLLQRLQSSLTDRYLLDREVGRGGMATVFLARDIKHDRRVALKVLHPELAATLGPERFLREIQIAARLQHPHILPLYDSGRADGLLYYVMPFVEGESLRDRLNKDKQLPVDDAVRIARDVAAALDYAHRQGVVHRDIKPENVMLHEGEAIVTDFGIAKAVSAAGSESLTQTGLAVGTPAYMSPEQASGEGEPDGRSDIYSLGCVLYEMLAGSAPFTGSTVQALMSKRFTEPVPSLKARRSGVSPELDEVVTKTLAREPHERFATAALLGQALGSARIVTPPNATLVVTPVPTAKSIAVLPFVNMSADPENEYFTDGIAEEIINALTKIQALRVASRTSAFAFKGKNEDIGEIGRKLKVATVLEGSVRKAGKKLRVTAQLVNVADGYHLWSERYDRELEDVFAIQDEISENIVKALRVVLSEDEKRAIEKAPTADVRAYDFYLRGRQFFHQFRRTGIQFARRMFERAIEIDPGYAQGYAGAADCCSVLYMYWDASRSNLEQADSYSQKALELNPEMPEAITSRALVLSLSQRYEEANANYERAIRLGPNLYEPHYFYGRALFQQGKHEAAVREYTEAARVRPEDYQAPLLMVQDLRSLGRTEEGSAAQRRGIALAERHLETNPEDIRALVLGASALMEQGKRDQALDWARRGLALDPEDSSQLYNVACCHALGGQKDEALALLDKAIRNGFGHREWLENDSDLASLRDDPRFQSLLARL